MTVNSLGHSWFVAWQGEESRMGAAEPQAPCLPLTEEPLEVHARSVFLPKTVKLYVTCIHYNMKLE